MSGYIGTSPKKIIKGHIEIPNNEIEKYIETKDTSFSIDPIKIYYEKSGDDYFITEDTVMDPEKTYYEYHPHFGKETKIIKRAWVGDSNGNPILSLDSFDMYKYSDMLPFYFDMGAVVLGFGDDKIHFLGGNYTKNHYSYDGVSFKKEADLPYNFFGGGAFTRNGNIYIAGGGPDGNEFYYSEYLDGYSTWHKLTDLPSDLLPPSDAVYPYYTVNVKTYRYLQRRIQCIKYDENNIVFIGYGGRIKKYDGNSFNPGGKIDQSLHFEFGGFVFYKNVLHCFYNNTHKRVNGNPTDYEYPPYNFPYTKYNDIYMKTKDTSGGTINQQTGRFMNKSYYELVNNEYVIYTQTCYVKLDNEYFFTSDLVRNPSRTYYIKNGSSYSEYTGPLKTAYEKPDTGGFTNGIVIPDEEHGKIYLLGSGGYDGGIYASRGGTNTSYFFIAWDEETDTWENMSDGYLYPMARASCLVVKDYYSQTLSDGIYIFGGGYEGSKTNNVYDDIYSNSIRDWPYRWCKFELERFEQTADVSFDSGKTYYEKSGDDYFITEDTVMDPEKTYYELKPASCIRTDTGNFPKFGMGASVIDWNDTQPPRHRDNFVIFVMGGAYNHYTTTTPTGRSIHNYRPEDNRSKQLAYNGSNFYEKEEPLPFNSYNSAIVKYKDSIHLIGGYYYGDTGKHYSYYRNSWTQLNYPFSIGSNDNCFINLAIEYKESIYYIVQRGYYLRLYKYGYNISTFGYEWTDLGDIPLMISSSSTTVLSPDNRYIHATATIYDDKIFLLISKYNILEEAETSSDPIKAKVVYHQIQNWLFTYDETDGWTNVYAASQIMPNSSITVSSKYNLPYICHGATLVCYKGFLHLFGGINYRDWDFEYITVPGADPPTSKAVPFIKSEVNNSRNHYIFKNEEWVKSYDLLDDFYYGSVVVYDDELNLISGVKSSLYMMTNERGFFI